MGIYRPNCKYYAVFNVCGEEVRFCATEKQRDSWLKKPIDFSVRSNFSYALRSVYKKKTGLELQPWWFVEDRDFLRFEERFLPGSSPPEFVIQPGNDA